MANERFYGSIDVTVLLEKAKEKHSSFLKAGEKSHLYANVIVWLNEDEDKFGNVMSIQLSSKKEQKEQEGKVYLGNLKRSESNEKPVSDKDIEKLPEVDDLPF